MAAKWQQGLTTAERQQYREALMDWYADHGCDEDHEMRKLGSSACAIGSCTSCDAEEPGGRGCPCECHDARADEVAERTRQWREGMAHA